MDNNIKVLPSAKEGERAVLGGLINKPDLYTKLSEYLKEDVFYSYRNRVLFKIIKDMILQDEDVDFISISSRLTPKNKSDGIDVAYISEVLDLSGGEISTIKYSKEIYGKFLMRKVISECNSISDSAYNNESHVYELIAETHTSMGNLIDFKPDKEFDISKSLDDTIESLYNNNKNIIKTGFKEIDKLSGGMSRGEITIVGGRPGHGKTTSMINMIKSCIEQGLKVIVFNREMSNTEMLKKLLVLESNELSYLKVRNGMVSDIEDVAELGSVKNAIKGKYNKEVFAMYDDVSSFEDSMSKVKKFKPDIIFDDYVQLIDPPRGIEQRRLQLERIVNMYKWLVKSENCVGVLFSQLNRGIEQRGDNKPKLSDIAESGAIEQVAENVLFVYYQYKTDNQRYKDGQNIIEMIGSKVRYGTSGSAKLGFNGDKIKLYNSVQECRRELMNGENKKI